MPHFPLSPTSKKIIVKVFENFLSGEAFAIIVVLSLHTAAIFPNLMLNVPYEISSLS